jgi:outer membrane protein assembly factor BamB
MSPSHDAASPTLTLRRCAALAASLALAGSALADWSNLGGGPGRNGLVAAQGPAALSQRWSGAPTSLISWTPIVEGDRLFTVRQLQAQSPVQGPGDSPVYAMRVSTGQILWSFDCPFQAGDWTTVVYGAKNGRVFVGRGGNGSSASAPVYCLDAATGAVLWVSTQEIATGAYDGVVFADDGDPIFATHLYIRRVDAVTGATLWNTVRSCSVSGDCGPARSGDSIYIDEVAGGGQKLTRIDIDTGAKLYSSATMPGFLSQNTPFCAPGGLVYYPRTQSNQTVDFLYAFRDTGKGFQQLWTSPAMAGAGSQHGITPDGGVVMLNFQGRLEVRDQLSGALRHQTASSVAASITQSHVAVDSTGRIFYGNGGFPGTIYSFNPDLTTRWTLAVPNLNQGGPVLAGDGTLLVAGNGTNFRAYYTAPCAPSDLNCDGVVNAQDLAALLGAWGGSGAGDLNGDGTVGAQDLAILLSAWNGQ